MWLVSSKDLVNLDMEHRTSSRVLEGVGGTELLLPRIRKIDSIYVRRKSVQKSVFTG